jgi:hypothetical protein
MTNDTTTRADVVLNRVEPDWRTTAYIESKLYTAGFHFGPTVTRNVLHALHDMGLVRRQQAGAGYRWRLTPPPEVPLGQVPVSAADMTPLAATADDLAEVSKRVAEIAAHLATAQPAASRAAAVTVVVGDECDLPTLSEAQEDLVKRIVRRAVYDTGKALLDVLDGWIEGAAENTAAGMGPRDADPEQFHADDIRRMVNDACRVMGAPEAWRKDESNV